MTLDMPSIPLAPLVLVGIPLPRETPKASGLGGRIFDLVRYLGLL